MKIKFKYSYVALAAVMITGCGGSGGGSSTSASPISTMSAETVLVSDVAKLGVIAAASSDTAVSNMYTLPTINTTDEGLSMVIPAGPLPGFSSRRTVQAGLGSPIAYGDSINIEYDMFSWSTGELVETTKSTSAMPVVLTDNGAVPAFLRDSLVGARVGEKMQVVLGSKMDDLPEYLDQNDAYVLVVNIEG